jgi:hypothetical protein
MAHLRWLLKRLSPRLAGFVARRGKRRKQIKQLPRLAT